MLKHFRKFENGLPRCFFDYKKSGQLLCVYLLLDCHTPHPFREFFHLWGSAALRVGVRLKFHWGDSPDAGRFTRACVRRFSCFCFHSVTFPCSVLGDSGLRSDRWGVFTVTHLSLCCHLFPFALFLFINRLHGLLGLSYSDQVFEHEYHGLNEWGGQSTDYTDYTEIGCPPCEALDNRLISVIS